MAIDTPGSMGFSIVDEMGVTGNTQVPVKLDSTLTVADQITQWQALATALIGVTGGKITGGDVRITLVPTTSQSTKPIAGSRIEQTAVTSFFVTGAGDKTYGIDAPAWQDSLISGDKPVVDSGAGQTWVEALTGTYTGGEMTNNTYVPLGALKKAWISFRKRRRLLYRASVTT